MTTEKTPKQLEVKQIEDLFNLNGYFTDEFNDTDLQTMVYNIASDFPLFLNTKVGNAMEKSEKLENEIKLLNATVDNRGQLIDQLNEEISDLKNKMEKLLDGLVIGREPGKLLMENFSAYQIIVAKLCNSIALDQDEIDIVRMSL